MPQDNSSARTSLAALLGDLNAGVFEQQINAAVSDIAANVVTHGRAGELTLNFKLKQIGSSNQVAMTHTWKASMPTLRGSIVENASTETPLHVGRGGKLSVYPEEQTEMFGKHDTSRAPADESTGFGNG